MTRMTNTIIEEIPVSVKNTDVLKLIEKKNSRKYFIVLKEFTGGNDNDISGWLNISVKTFQKYRKPNNAAEIKADLKEHTIMLLSLFKHGRQVFGNHDTFFEWLEKENFFFGNKKPSSFLNTISGIRFIDNRLTGIEFGDNV